MVRHMGQTRCACVGRSDDNLITRGQGVLIFVGFAVQRCRATLRTVSYGVLLEFVICSIIIDGTVGSRMDHQRHIASLDGKSA